MTNRMRTLLAAHLKELSELSLDFEIEATGFEMPEIDLRIQSLDGHDLDAADEFEVSVGPAVSRPGDIWLLNDHVVVYGSARDPAVYDRLPQEARPAVVFAGAPYNLRIKGHVSGLGKIKHREFAEGW